MKLLMFGVSNGIMGMGILVNTSPEVIAVEFIHIWNSGCDRRRWKNSKVVSGEGGIVLVTDSRINIIFGCWCSNSICCRVIIWVWFEFLCATIDVNRRKA